MKKLVLTLATVSLLWSAGSAHAANKVITSLPYEITASGTYVLEANLSSSQTSGNLITVSASNVTIDFQGHYISGLVGNTSQTTTGVYAVEQSNLAIRNGTIAYCAQGVFIAGNHLATTNSVGHQIDHIRATYCYLVGLYIYFGQGCRITDCQVSQIGYSGAASAYGIVVTGAGVTIQRNVVSTIKGSNTYGIDADAGSFARRNTVSNAYYGVYSGKYQDNLTANCTMPFSGGVDAGGNN